MLKDACATGFVIETKFSGSCDLGGMYICESVADTKQLSCICSGYEKMANLLQAVKPAILFLEPYKDTLLPFPRICDKNTSLHL
jgi:hypothetical protein